MTPVMKLIKFDLPINGIKVKTLEELRNNLTDELIVLARSGQLTRWLAVRKHHQEAELVSAAVDSHTEQITLFLALCEGIGVQVDVVDVATMFNPPHPAGRPLMKYEEPLGDVSGVDEDEKNGLIEVCVPKNIHGLSKISCLYYKAGDSVKANHCLALLDSGVSAATVLAPVSGVIDRIICGVGARVSSRQVIAYIRPC